MDPRVPPIVAHLEAAGFPFEAANGCPWLERVESLFGRRLPEPYRSLVEFFRFPGFEVPEFESFSNLGDGSDDDLTVAPFKDPGLRDWLIPRGFLQIGRPFLGDYDPICLDMSQKSKDPRIVKFDHEHILLCRDRVESTVVATSFMNLVVGNAA